MSFEWPIQKFLVHRHSSRHALRNQMIADTERFLNAAIFGQAGARSERCPTSSRQGDLLGALPATTPRVSSQPAKHATEVTILTICADGDLDCARLRRMLRPLDRIVSEACWGDVVLDFAASNPVSLRAIDVSAVLQRRVHQRRRKLLVCGLPDTPRFTQRAALMGIRIYATQHEAVEHALSSVAG